VTGKADLFDPPKIYHLESRWLATPKKGGLVFGAMINQYMRETRHLLSTLRILTPPMETPDPPNDTPGASK